MWLPIFSRTVATRQSCSPCQSCRRAGPTPSGRSWRRSHVAVGDHPRVRIFFRQWENASMFDKTSGRWLARAVISDVGMLPTARNFSNFPSPFQLYCKSKLCNNNGCLQKGKLCHSLDIYGLADIVVIRSRWFNNNNNKSTKLIENYSTSNFTVICESFLWFVKMIDIFISSSSPQTGLVWNVQGMLSYFSVQVEW